MYTSCLLLKEPFLSPLRALRIIQIKFYPSMSIFLSLRFVEPVIECQSHSRASRFLNTIFLIDFINSDQSTFAQSNLLICKCILATIENSLLNPYKKSNYFSYIEFLLFFSLFEFNFDILKPIGIGS